ncbi:hypothetical protein FGO68_gene987 [Halteria grandinella]|uniref:Uncharacterized protein n=1 Tax=Halteria grandinella TaxID=5974 RepID=A0A8J8NWH2_HALGN|nr:hypothetical protein FGO68_gene987 [Halteria grandinella]
MEDRLGLPIDYDNSFYCGDCAGRKMNPTTKTSDLKDSDYKFAINAGVKFITPEQLFWSDAEKDAVRRGTIGGELPDFSDYQKMLQDVINAEQPKKILQELLWFLQSPTQAKRMIVIHGPPACGKSLLLKTLQRVNPEYKFNKVNFKANTMQQLFIDFDLSFKKKKGKGDEWPHKDYFIEFSQSELFGQTGLYSFRKKFIKTVKSLGFETFAIEFMPYKSDAPAPQLQPQGASEDASTSQVPFLSMHTDPLMYSFCEHMDIVKKLKGQDDAYKDGFARVFRNYQPIAADEEWDTHVRIVKPFKVGVVDPETDEMAYRLL